MHELGKIKPTLLRPINAANSQITGVHPLLRRIYQSRGVISENDLDRSLAILPSPWLLSGMESIVTRLITAISNQEKVIVVADFDADGATSCALAVRGLRLLGLETIDFIVPNRFEYGYGLTPEIVDLAHSQQPDILLTVDNGISSVEGVASARAKGIAVLITDHHLPGVQLPDAEAIVNPCLPNQEFPCMALAGVGVMFYVLMAMRQRLRKLQWFTQQQKNEPNLGQLLDLVALGTVADVVPLDRINRALVHQGLLRIRSGKTITGIQALVDLSGRNSASLKAADLGFALGPRLNAAGRMDDMRLGIQCLLTDDAALAQQIAAQLDELNHDRKEIESQMKHEAMQLLQEMKALEQEHLPAGVCLFDENWHQGVIGILASRIKDRIHRPVIAFATAEEGILKGSARSITGVHIRDVLSDVAAAHPQLLEKFGGHAMAAGLSLKLSDYPAFAIAFNDQVNQHLAELDLEQKVITDGELTEQELNLQFAEHLQQAGPWGQAFPEPVFEGIFDVIQCRIVAKQHLKIVLRQPFGEVLVDAMAFFVEQPETWLGMRQIKAVYKLDINEYRGQRNIQFILEYLEKRA